MYKKYKKHNKGFTLVELIIVIAIMIILAVVVAVNFLRYLEKGRQAMDVYHGSIIKDALNVYTFPSDYKGEEVVYEDPETHKKETYTRGWVYVDKDEIRCSDASCCLAMIDAGLVHISPEAEQKIRDTETSDHPWYPSGPDGEYIRRSKIDEYVFKNGLCVRARRTWNTYQLDVYVDDDGELHLGASASNAMRTLNHAKDQKAAETFAKRVGLANGFITPIGEQYTGH
ncbi:prepilin-type N-terminal cleavage/methylation domain-containing protein [Eubacterium ruminantium]|uniref:Prepilin-type N-terminal cleavage/methylation domain-containing protein n=1 Tax=Eubacterium ruminantium TaxID=42322 RepID=A0A1T4NQG7_9FIRM|nr:MULTISPECIES: prepilin-type N-terminal cleavage/methylation domain-containing protein [Eubacterium]MCR5368340.1 prepilin-type N-terminal cleavage/methylation domain-containing protein [Eubacterium sp.]SCW54829.1 prepilin-type N-terminal cleavage/methylation domain-containing protein [Eubacterium ruminantium]SDM91334.1 prepilin-type N-terminal cleavage/methylation domain-containing protein [Eubacterium ruminantium]SJZ81433.1 prepilin-type N-terminal cleavage/methylation domain-containing prot